MCVCEKCFAGQVGSRNTWIRVSFFFFLIKLLRATKRFSHRKTRLQYEDLPEDDSFRRSLFYSAWKIFDFGLMNVLGGICCRKWTTICHNSCAVIRGNKKKSFILAKWRRLHFSSFSSQQISHFLDTFFCQIRSLHIPTSLLYFPKDVDIVDTCRYSSTISLTWLLEFYCIMKKRKKKITGIAE